MSIQQTRTGLWAVRWRKAGRMRSKSFRRKRDAERFDLTDKDAKQTGTLAALDGGRETLDDYVEHTWTPIYATPLAPARRRRSTPSVRRAPLAGARRLPAARADARGHRALASRPPRRRRSRRDDAKGADAARRDSAAGARIRPHREQPAAARQKASPPATEEVRPLAPVTIERSARPAPRDGSSSSCSPTRGYGPRKREACGGGTSASARSPCMRRRRDATAEPRSVRLLAPLAQGLREWRLLSGRPADAEPDDARAEREASGPRSDTSSGSPAFGRRRSRRRGCLPAPV